MDTVQRRTKTITEVIAARVREHRERHSWTQEHLAEEIKKLGHPIDRAAVSRIEGGKTRTDNLSLREVLVLAAALDVPPVLLFIPLGEEVDISLTPSVKIDPHLAFEWLIGDGAFCVRGEDGGNYVRNYDEWRDASHPTWLFHELRRLQDRAQAAAHLARAAKPTPHAQPDFDAALQALMQHRRYIRGSGFTPPPLPDEWPERAALLGLSDEATR